MSTWHISVNRVGPGWWVAPSPGQLVKSKQRIMASPGQPKSYPPCDGQDDGVADTNSENSGRRKMQRSGSFCEVEGGMKAGRLSVNLPKRAHSFRSCMKKPSMSTVEVPPSE